MTIFFVSDHHFDHENILNFKCQGSEVLIRPGFDSIDHMNETMVTNHNSVVMPDDDVYFGGDVCFNNKSLNKFLPRMNGRKRLILGNHDKLRMNEYYKYFEKIYSAKKFSPKDERTKGLFREGDKTLFLCHYPIHINSDFPNAVNCIHGHIHEKQIMLGARPDYRYFNISVERINYTPVSLEHILSYFRNNK